MRKTLHCVLCALFAERAKLRRTLPLLVLCAHCWLPLPVQASEESRANLLFVEAVKIIQAAEEETAAMRKLELLKDAKRKLETIVDRHPSSRLAVELVSGQRIGAVSLPGLVDAIDNAAVLACPQAPTPACLLSLAVATAKKIRFDIIRFFTLLDIAVAQAKAGYVVEALTTAKAIEDAYAQTMAFAGIAEVQAEKGEVRKSDEPLAMALAVAETVEDADERAWPLANIAGVLAKVGHILKALAIAEAIEDAKSRTSAFNDIAKAQVEKGDFGKARETLTIALAAAETIEDADKRALWIGIITAGQARAGYIVEALTTAKAIEDAHARTIAFAGIAAAQAEKDDFGKAKESFAMALAAAETIEGVDKRARRFGGIAVAQAKAGYIVEALATAEAIEDTYRQERMLSEIAAVQAKAGYIVEAFATAATIRDAEGRAKTLARIAVVLAESD